MAKNITKEQEHISFIDKIDEVITKKYFIKYEEERAKYNIENTSDLEQGILHGLGTIFTDEKGRELEHVKIHSAQHFVDDEILNKDPEIGYKKYKRELPRKYRKITADEMQDLEKYEAIINNSELTSLNAGLALLSIWRRRLYRARCASFKKYLDSEWSMSRARGYQLLTAATVYLGLKQEGVDITPKRIAPLLAMKNLNPGNAAKVYKQAQGKDKGKEPSSSAIKETIIALHLHKVNKWKNPTNENEKRFSGIAGVMAARRCIKLISPIIDYIVTREEPLAPFGNTAIIIHNLLTEELNRLTTWFKKFPEIKDEEINEPEQP